MVFLRVLKIASKRNLSFREIAVQIDHRLSWIGERDIGVRADQVKGIFRKTGFAMLVVPGILMQRDMMLVAPGRDVLLRHPIDVNLPPRFTKALEVVTAGSRGPGQAITASHTS